MRVCRGGSGARALDAARAQEVSEKSQGRAHNLLECDLEGALEAQGDCRGGIKTRGIFPSSAGKYQPD